MLKGLLFTYACLCFGQIQSKHLAEINLVQTGPTFKGSIHINGNPYSLNLKAAEESVFAPDFKLITPDEGPNGETIFRDITPSRQVLYEIERNVYTDVDNNAAFKIHYEQGELRVHGVLENMHISHDGQAHFALIHENLGPNDPRVRDYVYPPEERMDERADIQTRAATQKEFNVETYYIVDNDLWNQLNGSNAACANYIQLTTRAVNNRYATSKDPLFVFQVTGTLAMSKPSQQASFMDACPAQSGSKAYDMDCSLTKFGEYMAKNVGIFQKHDVAPLLSGADWMTKSSDGTWTSDTVGLAYIAAACKASSTRSSKVSISQDKLAVFAGTMTLAHEIAHNLGSYHDGDKDSKPCPWSDGYIMSYDGWGTVNKLFFSSCSLASMKAYANSDKGACLRNKNESASPWPAAKSDLGDLYNMTEQCRRLLGRSDATVYSKSTPDELCRNLKCSYRAKCSKSDGMCTWWTELDYPAYDNSVCDTNKKCLDGKCVVKQ